MLKKGIDLLLYSNLWIATAALAMSLQTYRLLFGELRWEPLWGFVFFGTIFLYALHRLVGLRKVEPFQEKGRFRVIADFRRHIALYALLSALAAAWFFFRLPDNQKLALLVPCLLSLGYVLPVAGGRRLRDLHYLKIFLIALAWAWITAALPAAVRYWTFTGPALLIVLERALFVFAITLPFDIRDLAVDAHLDVRTLPARLGITGTRRLAAACLLAATGVAALSYHIDSYPRPAFLAIALSCLIAYGLIHFSDRARHDYYFTGLIDGTMILQFVLVHLVTC